MIGKVCRRGSSVRRLLGYLFTEGLAGEHGLESEHHDAHVIAGYEPAELLEPSRDARGRPQLTRLAALLDAPVKAGAVGPDAKPVYHLAISAAPADRRLSDIEWADIAGQYVQAIGLAPQGDPDGVRWVAVRHADNHVHVVATLVRQDGRRMFPHHDFYRARETSLAVEQAYGLTRTSPVDRTAVAPTTRAEHRKHAAAGRARARVGLPPPPGPDREVLRVRVRAALAGSTGWNDFADRLRSSGVLVRERYSTVTPGQLTGYAVALSMTGPRARVGQAPVWFGGGKLAPDLSLPQLQVRWGTAAGLQAGAGARAGTTADSVRGREGSRVAGPDQSQPELTDDERQRLWQLAQDSLAAAIEELRQAADTPVGSAGHAAREAAAQAAAGTAGEVFIAVGRLLEGGRGGALTDASAFFERAARPQHRRTVPPTSTSRRLRTVAGLFRHAHIVKKAETRQLIELLEQLIRLSATLAALREAQQRAAQASAASRAAEQLRVEQLRRSAAAATVFAASAQQTTTGLQPAAYRAPTQAARAATRSR